MWSAPQKNRNFIKFYSLTLSYNLGGSPDDDTAATRSRSIDSDETSTVTTDTEMTDAMTGFTLDSPADNREILYSQTGMSLGPCPGVLPNLQMQMELDKLRRGDGQSRRTYPDMWSDPSLYQAQKDAMVKSVQQSQSRSTNTLLRSPTNETGVTGRRETELNVEARAMGGRRMPTPRHKVPRVKVPLCLTRSRILKKYHL